MVTPIAVSKHDFSCPDPTSGPLKRRDRMEVGHVRCPASLLSTWCPAPAGLQYVVSGLSRTVDICKRFGECGPRISKFPESARDTGVVFMGTEPLAAVGAHDTPTVRI